jgi:leucyl aminopeptidase
MTLLLDPRHLKPSDRKRAIPITGVTAKGLNAFRKRLTGPQTKWLKASGFQAKPGEIALIPNAGGSLHAVALGTGDRDDAKTDRFQAGILPAGLPAGTYRLADGFGDPKLAALAWALGAYRFDQLRDRPKVKARLVLPDNVDVDDIERLVAGVTLTRDLINQPANLMGPDDLERAARKIARGAKAHIKVIKGDNLLKRNFPMIHAVGRASVSPPRLIDLVWGPARAPKLTLVGKGVCFDTGGLNLKPGSSMALMKKDMGGAAHVLGLAHMIMAARLKLRLRVLIPAVENAVSGNAFRPGDVLASRKGLSVEIGNTDAEGRLVLADALALADEEKPAVLISMATLTGAARVALGPDLPPFYTDDDGFVNHIATGGMAGSMTAALFLKRFVEAARSFSHFDIYAWTPKALPGRPKGGEAQAIRALFAVLQNRFGR